MSKDTRTCCGHVQIKTGAALMGVLQTVVVVILLSTTAVVLERWHEEKLEHDRYNKINLGDVLTWSTIRPPSTVSGTWRDNFKWWNESSLLAFLKVHLVHHIAFYSLWLIFLVVFAFAFRYYRPRLVLPNLVMQVISLVLIIILAGVVIAKMIYICRQYEYGSQKNDLTYSKRAEMDARYAFYGTLLGCLVIAWLAELIFIWISIDFYHYLRDMPRPVYPGVDATTVHASSYHAPGHRETHVTAKTIEHKEQVALLS